MIAGFTGLLVILLAQQVPFSDSWSQSLVAILKTWPGWLIAVVFAGMLLDRKPMPPGDGVRRITRQGIMVWVIVLGETAVGLLAVWLLIQPAFDVRNSFGMLIETGFAGGHGTAAAMGEVFAHPSVDVAGGKDLGMLMATFGLVFGIVSGIFWINVGVRLRWIPDLETGVSTAGKQQALPAIGTARIDGDTIDPLLLQIIWLTLAFGIGLLMQQLVMRLAGNFDAWWFDLEGSDAARKELYKRLTASNVVDFPLFIYTLFGGLIVQRVLRAFNCSNLVDSDTIGRLTSTAMDVLVVAAIASLNLAVVASMAVPFLILFVCGAIWTGVCLLLISRLILPRDYWFQLGLINYGMSTGTTATGFVLLKMVDPNLKSGAAEDYALAAPLSAPFVGGGIITIALPLLLLERTPISLVALPVAGAVVLLVVLGSIFAKFVDSREPNRSE